MPDRGPQLSGTRSRTGIPFAANAGQAVNFLWLAWEVSSLDRFRVTNEADASVTAVGRGLGRFGSVLLVEVATGVPTIPLSFVASDTQLTATVPAGTPPGTYYLALVPAFSPSETWVSIFFVDPPLPSITQVTPSRATHESATALWIRGANLSNTSAVYLEHVGGSILPLEQLNVVSDTSLQAQVPAQLDAGSYTLRAVTPGGISVLTQGLQVDPAIAPLAEVLAASLYTANNDVVVDFELSGKHFGGTSSVLARGPTGDTPLAFSFIDASNLTVTFPVGLAPGLYQFIVTTPAGSNGTSAARFALIDPQTAIDYLGNGSVVGLNTDTVCLLGADLLAIVQQGRLRFLLNKNTGRPALSDDGDSDGPLGLDWESFARPAQVGASDVTLSEVSANTAFGGVSFRFDYRGEDAFRLNWGLAVDGALEFGIDYDVSAAGMPGNVMRIDLGSFGVAREGRHLVAAFGGVALGWNELAGARSFVYPEHYDLPIVFIEDPLGGGVLVDWTALADRGVTTTLHRRSGTRATRMQAQLVPHRSLLVQGQMTVARFSASSSGWADGVESHQAAVSNPFKPSWIDEVTSILRVIGFNRFADRGWSAQDFEDVYTAIEPNALPATDWRLFHVIEADEEGLAGLPDWNLSPLFARVGANMQAAGWRVVPYIPTPGVQDEHALFPVWSGQRLATWDKSAQALAWRFWDANQNGACCEDPDDYWLMNVGHAPYRDFVLASVDAGRQGTFDFEGIYFDFMKANVRLDDRNPLGGDATVGYRDLTNAFQLAFAPPIAGNSDFLIAGEGSSVLLTEAGNALAAIHVIEPGLLERDPIGGNASLAFAHPIGTHLVADQCRLTSTSVHGMPAWHQGGHYMARLADVIQGAAPTAAAIGFFGWKPLTDNAASQRALVQIAEEGLYWRLNGVRPTTDPDPLWNDPETLRLYEINGAVVARTKTWFVRKLVCDLYWHFGGRAPTPTEFIDLTSRTACNFLGVYAAMCEVRARFQVFPKDSALIQTRAQARSAIVALFPGYPVP